MPVSEEFAAWSESVGPHRHEPLYAAVDVHSMPATFGRSDLTRPVVEGSIGMIKTLLAHGADPNAKLKSRIFKAGL